MTPICFMIMPYGKKPTQAEAGQGAARDVGETAAQAILAVIKPDIEALAKGGSPVLECIKGYPSDVDEADASTMKEVMADIAAFQGRTRAVRAQPLSQRMLAAKALA